MWACAHLSVGNLGRQMRMFKSSGTGVKADVGVGNRTQVFYKSSAHTYLLLLTARPSLGPLLFLVFLLTGFSLRACSSPKLVYLALLSLLIKNL